MDACWALPPTAALREARPAVPRAPPVLSARRSCASRVARGPRKQRCCCARLTPCALPLPPRLERLARADLIGRARSAAALSVRPEAAKLRRSHRHDASHFAAYDSDLRRRAWFRLRSWGSLAARDRRGSAGSLGNRAARALAALQPRQGTQARRMSTSTPHPSIVIGANGAPPPAGSWRGIGCRGISERERELRG